MPITELSLAQSGSYSPGTDDAGKVSLRSLSAAALSHDNLDDNFYNLMAKVNECVTQLNTNTTALAEDTPWENVSGFPLSISDIGDAGKSLTSVDQLALGVTGAPTAIRIATNGAIELNGYLAPSYSGSDSKFVWKDADGILRIGPSTGATGNTSGLDSRVTAIENSFGESTPSDWREVTDSRISNIESELDAAGIGTPDTSDDSEIHPTGWTKLSSPARVRKWLVSGSTVQQVNSEGYVESVNLNFNAGHRYCYFFLKDIEAWSEVNTLNDDYTIDHPTVPANAKELLVYVRTHESNTGFFDGYEWRWAEVGNNYSTRDSTFIIPVYSLPSIANEDALGGTNSYSIKGDVDYEVTNGVATTHMTASGATNANIQLQDYQLGDKGNLSTIPVGLQVGKCGLRFMNQHGDQNQHVMLFCDILAYRL